MITISFLDVIEFVEGSATMVSIARAYALTAGQTAMLASYLEGLSMSRYQAAKELGAKAVVVDFGTARYQM